MTGRRGDEEDGTFLSQESTKEPAFVLEVGCFLCRGSLYEKGVGNRYASKLAPGFQAPFSVCFANPQGAALRTAALVRSAFGVAVFAAAKTSGKGERQLWLATPHQSPFGRQLPLKGKPFGGLRSSESLPLEGKVLSVAKRMRCSAPQSALSSFFSRSFRRSETAVPRGRNHTSSRQARTAAPSGAREVRRKRERRPSERACSHPWTPLSLFLLACRNKPTKRLVFGWVLGRGF